MNLPEKDAILVWAALAHFKTLSREEQATEIQKALGFEAPRIATILPHLHSRREFGELHDKFRGHGLGHSEEEKAPMRSRQEIELKLLKANNTYVDCETNGGSTAFKNETAAIVMALEWVLGIYR